MTENYYHLSAIVNGDIQDVLASKAQFEDLESDPTAFFLPGAEEVTNHGMVTISAASDFHVLPDTFGG